MITLHKYIFLFYLMKIGFTLEENTNSTGSWRILFISKDGSNIEPYSLLMLNQSDSKTSFCSSDYQLYDEIQIDHCVTKDLINWEQNPPDKVALTYTNQYGELLNFMVYNNSEVKLNSTSRKKWFNTSYMIESQYAYGMKDNVLKSINRNFVNSQESLHLMDINYMSVGVNFTNYTKTKWYHMTLANYDYDYYYFYSLKVIGETRCYRDTSNTVHLPVTDCESSENCLLCCSLHRKKMAIIRFADITDDSNSTCSCVDDLPEAVADQFANIQTSCSYNCVEGLCYNVHEISGKIISADFAYDITEDEFSRYNVKTQFNETEIKVSLTWKNFNGITLVTLTFCPEWILRYTGKVASLTADKDSITDQQSEYVRIIEGKFSRDVNDTLYTRLDFGPIATQEFTLQSLCGIDLSHVRITEFHLQRTTICYQNGQTYRHYFDLGLIHAPYMVVKGYWYDDDTLESTIQLSTISTIPESSSITNGISNENVTTIPESSSLTNDISNENVTTIPENATTKSLLREECVATDAYSVQKNGQPYQCKCFPEPNVTISAKLVEEIKDAISANLSVKTNTLSSTTRTKISAQDDRSSSKTIGLLGSILLGIEFALLVFLDSTYLIQVVHNLYNKIRQRHVGINEAIL